MRRCLYCYKELGEGETDFHPVCAKRMFGKDPAPEVPFGRGDMDRLAAEIIRKDTSLSGVQPKLSLNIENHEGGRRLTIVGLWGNYIFKPQTDYYHELPEVEDLTMHLASIAGIKTVPHSLIRISDGTLGYITRRIDRTSTGEKIAMEDFCQLTERLTEYKYKSSYEKVGKAILEYSSVPRLDCTDYLQLLLFCFLTGNNDMHLKNFSLYSPSGKDNVLTPAYDLVNAAIVNPGDNEEMALTLSGKKKKLRIRDFLSASETLGISGNVLTKTLRKWSKEKSVWEAFIDISFLSDSLKKDYKALLEKRFRALEDS